MKSQELTVENRFLRKHELGHLRMGSVQKEVLDKEKRHRVLVETPILFVHGMWMESGVFSDWMLSANNPYDSFSLDLSCHGSSLGRGGTGLGEQQISDYVDDIIRAVVWMKMGCNYDEPPIIVAHSMGGLAAMLAVEVVVCSRLALLMCAPPRGILLRGPVLRSLIKWRYLKPILMGQPFQLAKAEIDDLLLNGLEDLDNSQHGLSLSHESGRAARDILMWKHALLPLVMKVGNYSHVDRSKIHVFSGRDDRLIRPGVGKALAKKLGCTHHMLPANHCPMQGPASEANLVRIMDAVMGPQTQ